MVHFFIRYYWIGEMTNWINMYIYGNETYGLQPSEAVKDVLNLKRENQGKSFLDMYVTFTKLPCTALVTLSLSTGGNNHMIFSIIHSTNLMKKGERLHITNWILLWNVVRLTIFFITAFKKWHQLSRGLTQATVMQHLDIQWICLHLQIWECVGLDTIHLHSGTCCIFRIIEIIRIILIILVLDSCGSIPTRVPLGQHSSKHSTSQFKIP